MIKILPEQLLKECGWNGIDVGKGYIVSYCASCKTQRIQRCTGKKEKNGNRTFRFECAICKERLNGNGVRKYGKNNYGPVFEKAQQNNRRT